MARYERSIRVTAPLGDVWAFHIRVDGLVALTPNWVNLRIDEVTGPDGDPDPDVLRTGSIVRVSVRPLGIGTRRRWVTQIHACERDDGSAIFRDEMTAGPLSHWVHTHRFIADGAETIVRDVVDYELPPGDVGRAISPIGRLGLEPFFWYRHRQTKAHLEQ